MKRLLRIFFYVFLLVAALSLGAAIRNIEERHNNIENNERTN